MTQEGFLPIGDFSWVTFLARKVTQDSYSSTPRVKVAHEGFWPGGGRFKKIPEFHTQSFHLCPPNFFRPQVLSKKRKYKIYIAYVQCPVKYSCDQLKFHVGSGWMSKKADIFASGHSPKKVDIKYICFLFQK